GLRQERGDGEEDRRERQPGEVRRPVRAEAQVGGIGDVVEVILRGEVRAEVERRRGARGRAAASAAAAAFARREDEEDRRKDRSRDAAHGAMVAEVRRCRRAAGAPTILPMGLEADCSMEWKGRKAAGKALLETDEIIFRGDVRLKIARSKIA